MKRERDRKQNTRVQSTSAAAVFPPAFISITHTPPPPPHTHTQPLHKCLSLNLSLFATTLYDQQLREKDTLRGRAGQTKKEWKSSKQMAVDMRRGTVEALAAPLSLTAFPVPPSSLLLPRSRCIINGQKVIPSCAVTGLCFFPSSTFVVLIRKICLSSCFF